MNSNRGIRFGAIEQEIANALKTVYALDSKTPLQPLDTVRHLSVFLKREDVSRIHSYKWRGAFNKIVHLINSGDSGPFVATSAGNHAQGVALSARHLRVNATIFMPTSTPNLKQQSVKQHGGEFVNIELIGDSFDESRAHAEKFANKSGATTIPPFDDPQVIAGQATVAVEILSQLDPINRIYVPIGGGGLASGVAAYCKIASSGVKVIGVEVVGQDSMRRSVESGSPVELPNVDRFCDGTAVACPGKFTFKYCQDFLHDIITVTNDQVCSAIQMLWEHKRMITEPSGAIGLAGQLCHSDGNGNDVVIITGANTDFLTIPVIARKSRLSKPTRRYFQFVIDEKNGALISLLDQLMDGVNIIDFQYGKTTLEVAKPVLGFNATEQELDVFASRLAKSPVEAFEVTGDETVAYRIIPFQPSLAENPVFLRIDLPDRPGTLRQLMRKTSNLANICYFNFLESGESDGHALIGFESKNGVLDERFFDALNRLGFSYSAIDAERILNGEAPGT